MAELITKIGADSSQLRNDVNSLPGVVKGSFDKMKGASEGGITENVKGLKKGFADLKDVLLAGGAVEGVKRFFDFAIEGARASTNAYDLNAAAVRRFGDSLTGAKAFAQDFAVGTVGMVNRIGESLGVGAKMVGAFFSGSVAQVEQAEKVLEATDRAARAAELSLAEARKHAAAYNALTAETKSLTEARAAAEMKALPLLEQRDILQQKLLEAQRAEVDAGDNALERRKAQVAQLKLSNQVFEAQKAINDDISNIDDKRRASDEARHKAELDALDTVDKERILRLEIADAQGLINSGLMSAKDIEAQRAILGDRQTELVKTQKKLAEEIRKEEEAREVLSDKQSKFADELLTAQKKYVKAKKDEAALLAAIAAMPDGLEKTKAKTRLLDAQKATREALNGLASEDKEIAVLLLKGQENLTAVEKLRLEVLTGVTTQAKLDLELRKLTAKFIAGPLTEAEQNRLRVLTGQTAEVKNQAEELTSYVKQWDKFQISVTRTGSGYSSQSTTALQGVQSRLQSQLDNTLADDRLNGGVHVGGSGGLSAMAAALTAELNSVSNELRQRMEVLTYAKRFGEEATVRQFGDDRANKALNDLRDVSERTVTAIQALSTQISPAFPIR